MAISINTNGGALNALQNLQATSRDLEATQMRINTGLAIRDAKDNAAVFAIAQNLRADHQALGAVNQSLDRSISILDISTAAAESIQDLLIQMKEKAVAAADAGITDANRQALAVDFEQLRDQIAVFAASATFDGTNFLDGPADPPGRPDNLIALVSVDASLNMTVPRQNLALQAAGTVVYAPTDIIHVSTDTTLTDQATAASMIPELTTSIQNVSNALTVMGSASKAMASQKTFMTKLGDTIETGIGNLVDADMATESAKLQALQVKQQLGVQALSIANSQPQSILALFGK